MSEMPTWAVLGVVFLASAAVYRRVAAGRWGRAIGATRWSRAWKIVEDLFTLRCTITISDVEIGLGWIVIFSGGLAWLVVATR